MKSLAKPFQPSLETMFRHTTTTNNNNSLVLEVNLEMYDFSNVEKADGIVESSRITWNDMESVHE